MFSLDWVKNKAQVMGSAHLINDYVEHCDSLDKEVCPVSLYNIKIFLTSVFHKAIVLIIIKSQNVNAAIRHV